MCTNFALFSKGTNSTYAITARAMEFTRSLGSQIQVTPKGQLFPVANLTPSINTLTWHNKYGYVGMTGGGNGLSAITDGLNEMGLSVGLLWLPGSEYPSAQSATKPTIYNVALGDWILGNFESVESLKSGLETITVLNISEQDPTAFFPLHYIVSDNTKANLVIEFTDGQMQIYEPDNGVLTNAPPYPYHLANLSNYVNLSPKNNPQIWWGQEINGSGYLGMPGDYTPPSRYIRVSTLQRSTENYTPQNTEEAIGLANRILTNFGIPMGSQIEAKTGNLGDYTLWGVIRDHKELVYYFYTTFNSNLSYVDLKQINFAQGTTTFSPLIQPNWAVDITSSLSVN
jgi:penicillin V acylase-like amidase (Ntn superfamily)